MTTKWAIYWLTRVDSLHTFFGVLAGISGVIIIIYFLCLVMSPDIYDQEDVAEYKKNWGRYKKWAFGIGLFSAMVVVFMPTKSDIITIVAGSEVIEYMKKDSSLQNIPYKSTQLIESLLDKKIDELKEK